MKKYYVWINQNNNKGYLDENGDFFLDMQLMEEYEAKEVYEKAIESDNFIEGYDECGIEDIEE